MVTEISTPIVLGEKLKADLNNQIRRLTADWKIAISADRKRKIETQIAVIQDLLACIRRMKQKFLGPDARFSYHFQ